MDVEFYPEYKSVYTGSNEEREINIGEILESIDIYLGKDDILKLMVEGTGNAEPRVGRKYAGRNISIHLHYDIQMNSLKRNKKHDDLLDAFNDAMTYLNILKANTEVSDKIITEEEMEKLSATRNYYNKIRKEYK